ncbi:hypothetical protein EUGRSUZ_K01333 [Eucalyptus grandis]|uniref:Uncharacterized protein n=2 Tax=Eucalyptus grandis TaxID=71139 RepID=A0ACC3IUI9_EUCGR|nr:hypothetical protein EUGRSUZ_K01333 [Eucalyptus grandis]
MLQLAIHKPSGIRKSDCSVYFSATLGKINRTVEDMAISVSPVILSNTNEGRTDPSHSRCGPVVNSFQFLAILLSSRLFQSK